MWIVRRRQKDPDLETLSEYLDGRLSSTVAQGVEAHLAACQRCRRELETLQHTVSLLRRVPEERPRRSFTLSEAPVRARAGARQPAALVTRAPAWAYGAMASVAIVLFALVLTADFAGTLTGDATGPGDTGQALVTVPGATDVPQPSESLGEPGEPSPPSLAAAPEAPKEMPSEQPREAETAQIEMEAPRAEGNAEMAGASVNAEASDQARSSSEGAEAPQALQAPEAEAIEAAPATSEEEAALAESSAELLQPTPGQAGTSETSQERAQAQPGELGEAPSPGTSPVWHVLEGALAGAALALLAVAMWRRLRARRRTGP